MRNEPADTFTVDGLTVKLYQDFDPQNPRTEWDNFGHMVCWHRNYSLGDDGVGKRGKRGKREPRQFETATDFQEWSDAQKDIVVLPLYLFDHSGITMNTKGFSCPWDSGQVGYIYATREDILKNWNRKKLSKKLIEQARKLLVSEVEVYDQYLTGDVYGYEIEDADGNDLDSCWGFFGAKYAKEAATEAAQHAAKHKRDEHIAALAREADSAGDVPVNTAVA